MIATVTPTQGMADQPKSSGRAQATEITCRQAFENVAKLDVALKQNDVLALLGKPQAIDEGIWVYNFWKCAPPLKPGTQSVIGLGIKFEDRAISKIEYATVCATGPG